MELSNKKTEFIYAYEIGIDKEEQKKTQTPHRVLITSACEKGLESAFKLARLGSLVTVVDETTKLLPKEDPSVVYQLKRLFENLGVKFKLGINIQAIEHSEEGVNLIYTNNENGILYCLQADKLVTVN